MSLLVDAQARKSFAYAQLLAHIQRRTAQIAIIGMGYVGLCTALEFAEGGFTTLGVDTDEERIRCLGSGISPLAEVSSRQLRKHIHSSRLRVTAEYAVLSGADVVVICVPTPTDSLHTPDLSALIVSMEGIARHLRSPQLIVIRSTVYPGATDELCSSILARAGYVLGTDFFLATAPERLNFVSTGPRVKRQPRRSNIPVVVGGVDADSLQLATELFKITHEHVHAVQTARTAEMSKLLENTFRLVNIALIDEFALICERLGVDAWEVIRAASTKPFGFMAFTPGPGIGGHCIPVDPHYLEWAANQVGYRTRLIKTATAIGDSMTSHVLARLELGLQVRNVGIEGASILVLGVAFKPNISDVRNSPAVRLLEQLIALGASVQYHDPHVSSLDVPLEGEYPMHLVSIDASSLDLHSFDAIVVATRHTAFDSAWLIDQSMLLVDACGVTSLIERLPDNVIRLGTAKSPVLGGK